MLIHCLHYLYGTKDLGLVLMPAASPQDLTLTCYVDASYLSHPDSKSHHGWCLTLGKMGRFSSKSQKQTIVATSSTQAEMKALQLMSSDIVYVIHLLEEIGRPISLPAIILEDNQPVVDLLAEKYGRTNKSKHFLMSIAAVRQLVHDGLVAIRKIPKELNPADILTKPVHRKDFRYKRQQLLGMEPDEVEETPIPIHTKRTMREVRNNLSISMGFF
jgi:hypothetical protein